jgi:hypothetical protein
MRPELYLFDLYLPFIMSHPPFKLKSISVDSQKRSHWLLQAPVAFPNGELILNERAQPLEFHGQRKNGSKLANFDIVNTYNAQGLFESQKFSWVVPGPGELVIRRTQHATWDKPTAADAKLTRISHYGIAEPARPGRQNRFEILALVIALILLIFAFVKRRRSAKANLNSAVRFQFSLRMLFIAVAVAAVVCAWLGEEYRIVKERNAMREWIKQQHGNFGVSRVDLKPSIVRRWLGDEAVTTISLPNTATNEDVLKAAAAFSELEEIRVRLNE